MKLIVVEVTAEDIAKGVRGNGGHCPLARALSRSAGKRFKVGVWSFWRTPTTGDFFMAELTPEMSKFRKAFDQRQPVEPFSFSVEVPA